MKRRDFLTIGSAGALVGLSGRLNPLSVRGSTERDADDVRGSIRPDGDPAHIPATTTCDANPQHARMYGEGDVSLGDEGGFSLRVNETSFEYGETATITLTNTTTERKSTGNSTNFNFERYTEGGWEEVRDVLSYEITFEAIPHEPGDGLQWDLPLTEDGITAASGHSDQRPVCSELESARYRFTYWALPKAGSVAVEFDVVVERSSGTADGGE